jgi:hypothetical protein
MKVACQYLVLCNDALDEDGWALTAPFGEHPKKSRSGLRTWAI